MVRIIRNDDPDSYRDYSFTIDLDAPVIEATGAEDGGKTNADVTIGWEDKDVATATVSKDGTYTGITCDYDGYPTFMGTMLVDHYSDKKKVKTLLSLGDLSELERRIAPDPRQKHTFLVRQNFSCVFYGREKGDYTRMARTFKREDLKDTYVYIFKDGEWYMPQGEKDKKVVEVLDEIYLKEGFPRPKNFYGYLREEDKIGFRAQYQEKIRQDHIALQKQRAKEAMEIGY